MLLDLIDHVAKIDENHIDFKGTTLENLIKLIIDLSHNMFLTRSTVLKASKNTEKIQKCKAALNFVAECISKRSLKNVSEEKLTELKKSLQKVIKSKYMDDDKKVLKKLLSEAEVAISELTSSMSKLSISHMEELPTCSTSRSHSKPNPVQLLERTTTDIKKDDLADMIEDWDKYLWTPENLPDIAKKNTTSDRLKEVVWEKISKELLKQAPTKNTPCSTELQESSRSFPSVLEASQDDQPLKATEPLWSLKDIRNLASMYKESHCENEEISEAITVALLKVRFLLKNTAGKGKTEIPEDTNETEKFCLNIIEIMTKNDSYIFWE